MKVNSISKRFLPIFLIFSLLFLIFPIDSMCQRNARNEIKIPNIPGYVILKCDFHMHTVFSDGSVWPVIRVQEAWMEGLDAISITDHIEYQPHKKDVPTNHNRPYEIALPAANSSNILLIRAAEITRGEPPGHHNAIFLNDINPLDTKEFEDAVKAAVDQEAFVFWNHPGWKQPGRKSVWYDAQSKLLKKGWLHGIEVVNGSSYYPRVHKWCLEKNLTMISNSDVHNPITFNYDFNNGEHRPMTLVLAKERSIDAIKEALFARRTVVWWENVLIGEEKYLKPIFDKSIKIINPDVEIKGKGRAFVQIQNKSDVSFELILNGKVEDISAPKNVILQADKTVLLQIRGLSDNISGKKSIRLPYKVKNLYVKPEEGLSTELIINVDFTPAGKK